MRILSNEVRIRFARVLTVQSIDFDPIFALATFLDPRYSLLLDDEMLNMAKRELTSMVNLTFLKIVPYKIYYISVS